VIEEILKKDAIFKKGVIMWIFGRIGAEKK
jgi:hypothetical protein